MKKLKLLTKIVIGSLAIGIIVGGVYTYNLNIDKFRTPSVEKMYNTYMELEKMGSGYGDSYLKQFEGDRFFWGSKDKQVLEELKEKYPIVEETISKNEAKEQAKKEKEEDNKSNSSSSYSSSSSSKYTDEEIWTIAQHVVKENLKSPKSADFPIINEATITRRSDSIIVQSYVDADNSFGANIRSNFTVVLSADGKNTLSVSIE